MGTVIPETFFESILNRTLQEKKAAVSEIGGYVMFVITGDGGGIWTADCRKDGTATVAHGKVDDPVMTFIVDISELDNFVEGSLDVKKCVEAGTFGFKGDAGLGTKFATLVGGGSPLDIRAAT